MRHAWLTTCVFGAGLVLAACGDGKEEDDGTGSGAWSDGSPTVIQIDSPIDGGYYDEGEAIRMLATVPGSSNNEIEGAVWTAVDGDFTWSMEGNDFEASDLPAGVLTVTVSVDDGEVTDSVEIYVFAVSDEDTGD